MLQHNLITMVASAGVFAASILLQVLLRKELEKSVRGSIPFFIIASGTIVGFYTAMQFPKLQFFYHLGIGTCVGSYIIAMSLWMFFSIPFRSAIWMTAKCCAVVLVSVILVHLIFVTGGFTG